MMFSKEEIEELSSLVGKRLSQKRFAHVLRVLTCVDRLSEFFNCLDSSELAVAALLHDVTKELPAEEHLRLFREHGLELSEDDLSCAPIYHSLSAPLVVSRDFPRFATKNVLSAVKNHTTGDVQMSVFDEIIMIADYIEDGRTYDSCILVRRELFDELSSCVSCASKESALHKAVCKSIDFTEKEVIKRGRTLNKRSSLTKKFLSSLI